MLTSQKLSPSSSAPEQIAAQEDLKQALLDYPALRPIDYSSSSPVILAVDTSHIAVGYLLSQCDPDNPKIRRYANLAPLPLTIEKVGFSQPKLELYGLYRALGAMRDI